MTSEAIPTTPETPEKPKEVKDEAPVDNGQTKEEPPATEAKAEKVEEKKPEAAPPKPNVHKTNFEKDVVYLYQFTRTPVLPSTSPYCLKVETWIRLAGIKYQNVDHKSKFRSKKGQLPFVELNGEEIADSAIIVKELSKKFDKNLDAGLTPVQRGISHAMVSMIENHFSWVVLWWRAKYPESMIKGYQVNLRNALNTRLPNPILNICFKFTAARKGMKKAKAHGIGLHTEEEILDFGRYDMRVLSEFLEDKPYFFGDEPTLLDVVAFANLAQLYFIDKEEEHPLRDFMNECYPNLVGLVNRVKERAFPDWDDICRMIDVNAQVAKPKEQGKETKEGTGPAEKQPLADDAEKGKGDEKEKDQEMEPEDKEEK
ncbi:PREDICTED: failed axon connections [Papilio xuthus]|uniref:Failed axon connections n=1 Tax=Papilio xuthus TaxID=66420 RepID=A0AAJ6ZUF6_PAPXU|nr:PREDICTED: failed axon connections [Papilio xuthus]